MAMRKFRAWHEESKEMIYFNPDKKDVYIQSHFFDLIHQNNLIMMQFIGLQDCKGNDLYEGDIVDFNEEEWGYNYENETIPKITEFVGQWPLSGLPSDMSKWRTVVGNIYQSCTVIK